MRIYLSGQGAFAVQVAESLTESGYPINGIAAPYMRKGQSDESNPMHWDRLRAWAVARGVPWTPSPELRADGVPEDTDVLLAAHSHAFIGRRTRARARIAALGYHPSLLPLHRGRDAVRWTVRDRERVTGGTVYHLTERTDGGPIAAQEHVLVPPGQSARQLWQELLAPLGIRLIHRVLRDLEEGIRVEVPQDEALATWEPAMDSPPLFKPELPSIAGASSEPVIAHRWALVDR
ncbi:formyltransferase family protein [Streptomyces sp. NPDC012693]|uniref:formyltransferase family protein n=1 Tax=unclassified Streptomyces TaxID=2593676 RepID=UPI00202FCD6C|nr:formyltransferase family protein [Streptomyces sp. MSC1_001]